ncbi:MAG TPA: hypothetical protein VMU50_09810, partial [Polyangia bacterium]|nr:hypothetical protein [Polyangia bacterium]
HAGWCVGPRYIASVTPFLAAAVAFAWRRVRSPWALSLITAGLVLPSVFLNVLSGAIYPHYPEQYDNPVFDLTLPLLGAGYVPYSLGWLLGAPGLWSLAPLAAAVLAAVSFGVGGPDQRPRRYWLHASLATVMALALLAAQGRYGRKPSAAEAQATRLVRAVWEPAPRR